MTLYELKEMVEAAIEEFGENKLVVIDGGGMGYVYNVSESYKEAGVNTYLGNDISSCVKFALGSQIGMGTDPKTDAEDYEYYEGDDEEE